MSSSEAEQQESAVEWLTPMPGGEDVTLMWPDEQDGPLVLTCHWARVNGRAVMVGLDVRTFTDVDGERRPGPGGVREVLVEDLRQLNIREIREASRLKMATDLAREAVGRSRWRKAYEQRLEALTMRTTPSKRQPPADDALLRLVAHTYNQAMALGGTPARRPAVYVTEQLREKGWETSSGQVRQLIMRARQRGLLPPATPRRPG